MKRLFYILAVFILVVLPVFADEINMEFRNQKITDILYSLAQLEDKTVYCDETVTGNASFTFRDKDFETALQRFCSAYALFIEQENGVYNISKVKVGVSDDGLINLDAQEVNIGLLIKILSRKAGVTIVTDTLPQSNASVHVQSSDMESILRLLIVNLAGFDIEVLQNGFYLYKAIGQGSIRGSSDNFTLIKVENTYNLTIKKASVLGVIENLFSKENKEYVLLSKPNIALENLSYKDKDFESMLKILLQQCSCDYSLRDDVYYIFEIQKSDILRNYRLSKAVQLKNITVDKLLSIIPSEMSASSFMKTDRDKNLVYLTGSESQIESIEKFIKLADNEQNKGQYRRFDLVSISPSEAASLIPKDLILSDVIAVPDTDSFIVFVLPENESALEEFVSQIDGESRVYSVNLRYIRSDELLKNLPPSVEKKDITETGDIRTVFFRGSKAKYEAFMKELSEIDKPKEQIRYSLLVIQRQRTDSLNWATNFKVNTTDQKDASQAYSSSLGNIFNINFDIISNFGWQFAQSLNSELSSGLSHVLADTTLNGISGQSVKFSNTNTYRYRDIVIEGTTDRYTSTTREITSGLVLNIEGWVSGDDMITVSVDATVSKQGAVSGSGDTSNPPSTSEKKVSTTVRTHSGEPVIIGGLLQQESDSSENGVPGISEIPVVGQLFKDRRKSESDTEFIIYLIPTVQIQDSGDRSIEKNIRHYYEKYVMKSM